MRAIQVGQFGDPEVMRINEISLPPVSENQVLIDVKAIGVNPVDTYIRAGLYPSLPNRPYTPGKDAAGIITAVGPEVKDRKIGDRVYCCGSLTGCYAEQVICEESTVFPMPDNIDFSLAAAVGIPYSTAYFALYYRAHCMPGETLLVHGASGSVGLAALQLAKSNGIKAIGTAGTTEGLKLITQQGAIAALNHNEESYLDKVDELTHGQGVDVILEMLANVNLQKDLELLAKYGRVAVIGNRGTIEIDPRIIMGRNASIFGMSLFNATDNQMRSIHAAIYAGLENGSLKPIISTNLPLEKASEAHRKVLQPGAKGKVILTT